MPLDSDVKAVRAARGSAEAAPDILSWLKSWWQLDDAQRADMRFKYGPDVAHLLRGVADMIEGEPPAQEAAERAYEEFARQPLVQYCGGADRASFCAGYDTGWAVRAKAECGKDCERDAERYRIIYNGDLPGYAVMQIKNSERHLSIDGGELEGLLDSALAKGEQNANR